MRPGEAVKCIFSKTSKNGCGTTENCKYCGAVNAILESQDQKKKVSRECRITTLVDDQHEFMDIQVTATPFNYKGKTYTIFSVDDISDKKRRLMLERIFFHDIVNIAGAIKGFSEILMDNKDQEQIAECLDAMGKLSKELVEEIISQRTLHDAETGDLSAHITSVNSTNLIKDTLSYLSKSEYTFGKLIIAEADNVDINFTSDETLLKRVLINMLKNALEASYQGDIVRVKSEIRGKNLVFSVNNPSEMSEAVKLQVFQRSFSTKGNNRGIGTYSIRILTERYLKGKVDFTSTRENGTTFFVYLPLE
jgi:signal transduction histidine kinase